jgi:hypothetical protein
MEWQLAIATLINGSGVFFAVLVIKSVLMPFLRAQYPWVLPIIAMVAGYLIGFATEALMAWLGYPIDLSTIVAALTGAGAVAVHQIKVQAVKSRL